MDTECEPAQYTLYAGKWHKKVNLIVKENSLDAKASCAIRKGGGYCERVTTEMFPFKYYASTQKAGRISAATDILPRDSRERSIMLTSLGTPH